MPTGAGGGQSTTLTAFQNNTTNANNAAAVADLVTVTGVIINSSLTFAHIIVNLTVADVGAGLYDLGLYNLAGALVANIGAQTLNIATGTTSFTITQGSKTIPAGLYAFAYTNHGATNAARFAGQVPTAVWIYNAAYAVSSGGALPASVTALTVTPAIVNAWGVTFLLS